jgi:glycosyltransferase involved in cell wall biosynthesis
MKGISVVIPVYNEELNVAESYQEVSGVLRKMGRPYEIIFVDDGSKDKTVDNLLEIAGDDPSLKLIQFRRNFGQTAAMAAGLEHSMHDIVITLDGDLQNDPAEIPRMVAKLEEGYDMVAGWRQKRQDALVSRKLPSRIANWLISKATKVSLHDYGCTLKAMTGEVARGIRLYGEMHRFIPALAAEMGAKIVEIPVNHRARKAGTSKYGISRTLRVVLDLITVKFLLGYSKRPIHLFGSVGLVTGGLGFLILSLLTYQRFFMSIPMGNRPLLSLGVLLIIVGAQFFCFGLVAEVLARTYYESQDKAIYAVRRVVVGGQEDADIIPLVNGQRQWNRRALN